MIFRGGEPISPIEPPTAILFLFPMLRSVFVGLYTAKDIARVQEIHQLRRRKTTDVMPDILRKLCFCFHLNLLKTSITTLSGSGLRAYLYLRYQFPGDGQGSSFDTVLTPTTQSHIERVGHPQETGGRHIRKLSGAKDDTGTIQC